MKDFNYKVNIKFNPIVDREFDEDEIESFQEELQEEIKDHLEYYICEECIGCKYCDDINITVDINE